MKKAIHKNLGEVEVIGEDVKGLTKVKTKDGAVVEATTLYLRRLPDGEAPSAIKQQRPGIVQAIVTIIALCFGLSAQAQLVGTNSLSLQAVATTTVNGTAFSLGGISIPVRQHLVQNTGITGPATGTNALMVNIQLSLDGSNWTTVSTYIPSSTNATVDLFAPSTHNITCYMRAQAVTTNTVTVGVTTIKP